MTVSTKASFCPPEICASNHITVFSPPDDEDISEEDDDEVLGELLLCFKSFLIFFENWSLWAQILFWIISTQLPADDVSCSC